MVAATLKLGIAILNGGNSTVQQVIVLYLNIKKIPLNCKYFYLVKVTDNVLLIQVYVDVYST